MSTHPIPLPLRGPQKEAVFSRLASSYHPYMITSLIPSFHVHTQVHKGHSTMNSELLKPVRGGGGGEEKGEGGGDEVADVGGR